MMHHAFYSSGIGKLWDSEKNEEMKRTPLFFLKNMVKSYKEL
jgi:hypothetical protein